MQQDQKVSERALKRRTRKGIPDSMRGIAWPALANCEKNIPDGYGKGYLGKQAWMKNLLN